MKAFRLFGCLNRGHLEFYSLQRKKRLTITENLVARLAFRALRADLVLVRHRRPARVPSKGQRTMP